MKTVIAVAVEQMLQTLRVLQHDGESRGNLPLELQTVWDRLEELQSKADQDGECHVRLEDFKISAWKFGQSETTGHTKSDVMGEVIFTGYTIAECDALGRSIRFNWAAITRYGVFEAIGLIQSSSGLIETINFEIVGDDGEELGASYVYRELLNHFGDEWKVDAIEAVQTKLNGV